MAETSDAHKDKTVKLLNSLFDQDPAKKEAILLIQNNSACDLILRLQSKNGFYNVAVPSKGENTLLVNKGVYELVSNVCDVKYVSNKEIIKDQLLILNNPVRTVNGTKKIILKIGCK